MNSDFMAMSSIDPSFRPGKNSPSRIARPLGFILRYALRGSLVLAACYGKLELRVTEPTTAERIKKPAVPDEWVQLEQAIGRMLVAEWRRDLESPEEGKRERAAMHLADYATKTKNWKVLENLLVHPDPNVQFHTLEAVSELCEKENIAPLVPALIRILDSNEEGMYEELNTQMAAAAVVVNCGRTGKCEELLKVLQRAEKKKVERILSDISLASGERKNLHPFVPIFILLLNHPNNEFKFEALQALNQMAENGIDITPIVPHLRALNPKFKVGDFPEFGYYLQEIFYRNYINTKNWEEIRKALKGEDRWNMIWELKQAVVQGCDIDPLVTILIEMTKPDPESTRIWGYPKGSQGADDAAQVLTQYYARKQNWTAVDELLKNPIINVRVAVLEELATAAKAIDISPLIPVLRTAQQDTDPKIKQAAQKALESVQTAKK